MFDSFVMPWADRAACAAPEVDPNVFQPPAGESSWAARKVCKTCPVVRECLEYAVADPSLEGVWGGATSTARKALRLLTPKARHKVITEHLQTLRAPRKRYPRSAA